MRQIKKAFRKLALKVSNFGKLLFFKVFCLCEYHPDKNQGDAEADSKFKEITVFEEKSSICLRKERNHSNRVLERPPPISKKARRFVINKCYEVLKDEKKRKAYDRAVVENCPDFYPAKLLWPYKTSIVHFRLQKALWESYLANQTIES